MQVMLSCLPDPTDVVLQGEIIGDSSAMDWQLALAKSVPVSDIPALLPLVAGSVVGDKVLGDAVPRALVGQSDWYGIRPRTIGPMCQAGGRLEMLAIGTRLDPDLDAIFVDPTQKWQATVFAIDKCGFPLALHEPDVIGAPEPIAQFQLAQPIFPDDPVVTVPRGAVYRSGIAKRMTAPVLAADFGGHTVMDSFVETTRRWFVGGVTRDGQGDPLPACRVLIMQTEKMIISPDVHANPIEADIISDGAGTYSAQVPNNLPRQILGYKAGGPDVGGLTVNTVIPEEV